jgi:cellulose synthase (UDP-forming)
MEIGTQDLRLEFDEHHILNLEMMQQTRPLIGLLVSQDKDAPQPQSLLVQVEMIEELVPTPTGGRLEQVTNAPNYRIAMELSFPESLKRQQQPKIQRLLKTLE